jgi:hypothetical protein
MDITAQTPAEGIMLQKEFTNAVSYTIACDCGDPAHNVNMWIESKADLDTDDVTLTFYVTTTNKWWSVNRWKQIWQLITAGHVKQESTLILSKQAALNLSTIIRNSTLELGSK